MVDKTAYLVAPAIARPVNLSLETATILWEQKSANVTPIPNNGDETELKNYRLISHSSYQEFYCSRKRILSTKVAAVHKYGIIKESNRSDVVNVFTGNVAIHLSQITTYRGTSATLI